MQYIQSNKKRRLTLENLPDDVLLELFEYFNGMGLLHTFDGLNHRFTHLLYHQFRCYSFDLTTRSKRKFDIICRQYLPFLTNRVIKLRLGEIGRIPQQMNYFFSYISSLTQFTHLRSLTIDHVYPTDIVLKLIDECQQFHQLTYLDIHSFSSSFSNQSTAFELYLDKIWSLPKLTHLILFILETPSKIFPPTKISSTLKFIQLSSLRLFWSELDQLFQCTPHLKHLSLYIKSIDNYDLIPTPPSTLVQLTIGLPCSDDTSIILLFLQKASNLRHLNITLMSNVINGNQWEQLIRHHLSKLKQFHLTMKYEFHGNINIQDQANQIIDTFRSSFWTEEQRWFVRYHLVQNKLHLFTLSNAFHYYNENFPDAWKSTDPNDNQQTFYSHITMISDKTFFNQSFTFDLRLSKIDYLCIKFPINEQFWSIISSFKKLYSLTISSYSDTFQSQLQTIIDQAPELGSLKIYHDELLLLPMSLFKLTNLFLHELTLENYHFNEEECMTLSHSQLAKDCQSLSIHVTNRQSIVILVENMINLRMLNVQYAEQIDSKIDNDDEVVEWLKDHLPSTCLITKDPTTANTLQIWI